MTPPRGLHRGVAIAAVAIATCLVGTSYLSTCLRPMGVQRAPSLFHTGLNIPFSYEAYAGPTDITLKAFLPDLKGLGSADPSNSKSLNAIKQVVVIYYATNIKLSVKQMADNLRNLYSLNPSGRSSAYGLFKFSASKVKKYATFGGDLFVDHQQTPINLINCSPLGKSPNPMCSLTTNIGSGMLMVDFSRSHLCDWQEIRRKTIELLKTTSIV